MGLLNTILGRPEPMGPEWEAFLKDKGFKPGQDVGQQQVNALLAEYGQYRQQGSALKPSLNQYGPDAAKAIGTALIAGGPAAGMAQQRLGMLQQKQDRALPFEERVARLPLLEQAQLGSEMALGESRRALTAQTRQEIEQAAILGPLNVKATQSLIRDREASAAASLANATATRQGKITAVQGQLNDKFLRQMDAPTQVADATQQIEGALGTQDSLGALAATIKLAKVLDPTSVVREGEVTTVQGGTGTAANLIAQYNKIFGQGFSPDGARRFREITRQVAGPVLQRGLRIEKEIRAAAHTMEVNPDMAATGIGWPSAYVKRYVTGMPDPLATADMEL